MPGAFKASRSSAKDVPGGDTASISATWYSSRAMTAGSVRSLRRISAPASGAVGGGKIGVLGSDKISQVADHLDRVRAVRVGRPGRAGDGPGEPETRFS